MATSFPNATVSRFDEEKFVELILYVADRHRDHRLYGATKLNKILFEADFRAYAALGSSITGATYQALKRGPAPRELKPVRREMEQRGEIVIVKRGSQHRVVPLREPDLSRFSASEISIVDDAIRFYSDLDADESSEASHKFLGWEAAIAEGERTWIPYETVFVSNQPLDPLERSIVLREVRRYESAP